MSAPLAAAGLAWRMRRPLASVLIGALVITALAVWQVTGDGEAVAFEGLALVALYVILAVLVFFE